MCNSQVKESVETWMTETVPPTILLLRAGDGDEREVGETCRGLSALSAYWSLWLLLLIMMLRPRLGAETEQRSSVTSCEVDICAGHSRPWLMC